MVIRGVIFDLDGTLADSRLDFVAMRQDLGITAGMPILEWIDAEPNAAARAKAHATILRHEMAGALSATLMPGASDLLSGLRREGIKTGIFTRNARAVTTLTLERLALSVDVAVAREDGPPKPDPSGLLAICADWGVGCSEVIFVGDYLYDLDAGKRAGIKTILFAPDTPDFTHDCLHTIQHLSELWRYITGAT